MRELPLQHAARTVQAVGRRERAALRQVGWPQGGRKLLVALHANRGAAHSPRGAGQSEQKLQQVMVGSAPALTVGR